MDFGPVPTADAAGAILAHATSFEAGGRKIRFKKGRILTDADTRALVEADIGTVIVARLNADDLHEDAAADRIGIGLLGAHLKASAAFTGRVNISVERAGVLRVDAARIARINRIDPAITLATLPDFAPVEAGQIVATLKIIPFAAARASVAASEDVLRDVATLMLHPYRRARYTLIQTLLPSVKDSVLDKTSDFTNARIASVGGSILPERRCRHSQGDLAEEIRGAVTADSDTIIIVGASAITDRADVIPGAIESAGGSVLHFGMPVDPGNLLMLGRVAGTNVIGAPGCVRSPKLNGADWVLQRLAAGIEVGPEEIADMGVGGLLKDIPSRPLPRAEATGAIPARRPRIAAILLAAGQSRRMGALNKLIEGDGHSALVARSAAAIADADLDYRVVVTGHESDAVLAALDGLEIDRAVHNPDFAGGLSTSLKAGIATLPHEIDGVIICLGDMPGLRPETLRRLTAAFDPPEGRSICVPTHAGKRGNPVLFARRFFDDMMALSGDSGAKHLIGTNEEVVVEVAIADDHVLRDIDTPDDLARWRADSNA